MLLSLRHLARQSKLANISYHLYDTMRTWWRFKRGVVLSSSGSTHASKTLAESLGYINTVFDDYLVYGNISMDALQGKRILEIGPGDNLGVALRFLAAGARQVVCLDKFFSERDQEQQRAIYLHLREQLSVAERVIFDDIIDLHFAPNFDEQKLRYIYGTGIEDAADLLAPETFDFIISRAVLQGVQDLDAAFSAMDSLLAPGGSMLHKIDLRDTAIFNNGNHHPLTFLTVPDTLYRLMTFNPSVSNRKRVNYYRAKLAELDYHVKIFTTFIVGGENELSPHKERIVYGLDYADATLSLLKEIHPHLQAEFKNITDEDLMIAGIFLVAQK